MKFIFVSGGVVSGLGKGITAASIGTILKSMGYRVTNVKIDMYLNVDAGTIRPQEHGEVFVLDDGMECDQDLGNYERFLGESLRKENYMTTGQVYKSVIERERAFGYEGEDVEAVPHVTDEIIERVKKAGAVNKAEIVVIELGGTVGEYQNGLFFEASRILHLNQPKNVIHVHVTYLPFIKNIGELKSKPAQQSVHMLNSMGIQPDFLVARSEQPIDQRRRERLSVFCSMQDGDIISAPDLPNIYEVPLYLEGQKFGVKIAKKLRLKKRKGEGLSRWKTFNEARKKADKEIKIAMVGKYFVTGDYMLVDSYVSVVEAIKQAAWTQGVNPEIAWIDSSEYEKGLVTLDNYDGIIVPQGWGKRGVEGKILAVKYAREKKVPYLGLCFGMQMAVIEFARDVLKMKGANSTEADPRTKFPVIHVMPEQAEYLKMKQYGGTIRLGTWPCKLEKGSKLKKIYKKFGSNYGEVNERHRHRYEFNNSYRDEFEKAGMKIAGTSPDGKLVEAVEIPEHPFFIGTQFHPEYIARPMTPHPIFIAFVEACLK